MNKERKRSIESLAAVTLLLLILGRIQRSWDLVIAAVAVLGVGLLWQTGARLLDKGWRRLAEGLGFISSRVLLTLVYCIFLFPLSLFARHSKKLTIKRKPAGSSNFKDRNHIYTKEDLENLW